MTSPYSTIVNGLIFGPSFRWTNLTGPGVNFQRPLGSPTVVTYSFSESLQPYLTESSQPGFRPLSATERDVFRGAAAAWDRASGLVLVEVGAGTGDIQVGAHNFAGTSNAGASGYANYPATGVGGDIFFNTGNTFSLNFVLSAHELGHALGLKHPGDQGQTGVTLPRDEDNTDLTLMSYTRGSVASPTSLGSYDVAAVQYLYGQDVPASALYPTGYTPEKYLAANPDLLHMFGVDVGAANYHYLISGMREGRSASFDGLRYAASYGDLAQAFGPNEAAAMSHYLASGAAEGRDPKAFNPYAYLASYTDLQAAFGTSAQAAEIHYLTAGRAEGRSVTFDAYGYLASNPDLLTAFKGDTDQGALHYLTTGRAEGRSTTTFNASSYMAANPDLAVAFAGDLGGATRHYVATGWKEGRQTAPATAMRGAAFEMVSELQSGDTTGIFTNGTADYDAIILGSAQASPLLGEAWSASSNSGEAFNINHYGAVQPPLGAFVSTLTTEVTPRWGALAFGASV